jgi:hypothetical protein
MEKKISIVICAFDNWKRVERALRRLDSFDLDGFERMLYIFNPGYPLPSKQENKAALLELADKHCAYYQDIENRGQVGNFRQIAEQIKTDGSEIYYFLDTDHNPDKPTFLQDAFTVMTAEPLCDFVTINCSRTDNSAQHQKEPTKLGGITVRRLSWHGGYPLFIFRRRFVEDYPMPIHNFYGGDEYLILEKLKRDYKLGYMMSEHDDVQDTVGVDADYVAWKRYAIDKEQAISFAEYLERRNSRDSSF